MHSYFVHEAIEHFPAPSAAQPPATEVSAVSPLPARPPLRLPTVEAGRSAPGAGGSAPAGRSAGIAAQRHTLLTATAVPEDSAQRPQQMHMALQTSMQTAQSARDAAQRQVRSREARIRGAEDWYDRLKSRQQQGEAGLGYLLRMQQRELREWRSGLQQARDQLHYREGALAAYADMLRLAEPHLQQPKREPTDVDQPLQHD
jgi:hypothetical protein